MNIYRLFCCWFVGWLVGWGLVWVFPRLGCLLLWIWLVGWLGLAIFVCVWFLFVCLFGFILFWFVCLFLTQILWPQLYSNWMARFPIPSLNMRCFVKSFSLFTLFCWDVCVSMVLKPPWEQQHFWMTNARRSLASSDKIEMKNRTLVFFLYCFCHTDIPLSL